MAVEIALKFSEKIGDERMEIASGNTGANIRKKPALHGVVDLARSPVAFFRRAPLRAFVDGAQEFGMLRKDGLGEGLRLTNGIKPHGPRSSVSKQIVQGYIETEICVLLGMLLDSHPALLKFASLVYALRRLTAERVPNSDASCLPDQAMQTRRYQVIDPVMDHATLPRGISHHQMPAN
jgi:hypothetical protein